MIGVNNVISVKMSIEVEAEIKTISYSSFVVRFYDDCRYMPICSSFKVEKDKQVLNIMRA